jgi:hypothetical protein
MICSSLLLYDLSSLPLYDLFFFAIIWSVLLFHYMICSSLPLYDLFFFAIIWSVLCHYMICSLPLYDLFFAIIWSVLCHYMICSASDYPQWYFQTFLEYSPTLFYDQLNNIP